MAHRTEAKAVQMFEALLDSAVSEKDSESSTSCRRSSTAAATGKAYRALKELGASSTSKRPRPVAYLSPPLSCTPWTIPLRRWRSNATIQT